ncbi:ATP-dependent DNA helicase-like protein mph1 [Calycina marina]|uniref:ATP-dependent DNA helicase n=1 Tax=Calycina marina TaxID=1763456 RepID=A0A9P7Z051_9HELO|nr:ATP-dependent DNA helicase-like protein mph1 [Calycina marina]
MPSDKEDYGEIPDEHLFNVDSEPSQTLPPLLAPQRRSTSYEEEEVARPKKRKHRIHEGAKPVPEAKVIGATQAELYEPSSSPYRIRGPIYTKSRPRPVPQSAAAPLFTKQPNVPRYKAPPGNPPSRASFGETSNFPKLDVVTKDPIVASTKSSFTRIDSTLSKAELIAQELDAIPDDFFSSPDEPTPLRRPIAIGSSPIQASAPRQRLVGPQTGLVQTTLFGGRAPNGVSSTQAARKVHNYKVDLPPEAPTHHRLNEDTLSTWIYPSNLGEIRKYQYSIVHNGLFNNLLVALPTGLGKTFIAATIMYNYYRWTNDAHIVFVAPTKPLVAQQVDACFKIVGLPRSTTTMLTGEQAPAIRAEEWEKKRVFFMTPQTLINDLSTGIADPKKIVLLVVDEAHRATGEYAYNKVVQFVRRFNKSFRVLALTATPGATVEQVQEVIDGLEISKVEIRTEESIDIRPYTHKRNIDQILLDPSDEIMMVKELLTKALQPVVNTLCQQNAYWSKDPMAINSFGLMQARERWAKSDAGRKASHGVKGMLQAIFSVLQSVAHCIKLLNFHGIGPFHDSMKTFKESLEDGKPNKYKTQIVQHQDFKIMMDRIRMWTANPDFVGHPKLTYLCDTVLNHFMDAGDGKLGENCPPSNTRVIVFSEYRDSAEEIVRILNRHKPLIRASVFVGQADSKRSLGMNQEKQQETIKQFQKGIFNVIVATSIGEEGLDIGSVDLIVCYDASGSPIRMLQRMGRTGRKRVGNIVLLLMRGKEEENFVKAKDNYEQMQKMISSGAKFNFRHDLSVRILPKDIVPQAVHEMIDIPPENSQDSSLPIPKKSASRAKKKPSKKFHMPDGVETGFQKASRVSEDGTIVQMLSDSVMRPKKIPESQLASIPDMQTVLLNPAEKQELENRYQNIAGADYQEVEMPSMTSHPEAQRSLQPTVKVKHGSRTKKNVKLFKKLSTSQRQEERNNKPYGDESEFDTSGWDVPALVEETDHEAKLIVKPKKALTKKPAAREIVTPKSASTKGKAVSKKARQSGAAAVLAAMSDSDEHEMARPTKRQRVHKSKPRKQPGKQVRKQGFSMSMEEGDEPDPEPSSEGEGDDLARSEVQSEDDSDGESLAGFIVGSDAVTISTNIPSSPPTMTQSSPALLRTAAKRLYKKRVAASQDSVDDVLLDIDDLVSERRRPPVGLDPDSSSNLDSGVVLKSRLQQRRVVESDNDE